MTFGCPLPQIVPDSCESEDNTPSAIPLPMKSPLKPALASPKKNKTPSPKKVAFLGVVSSDPTVIKMYTVAV